MIRRFSDTCSVTSEVKNLLIRKHDTIVKHLKLSLAFGVVVRFGQDLNLTATIEGDDQLMVAACKREIMSYITEELPVTGLAHEFLPGPGGADIKHLAKVSGCNLSRLASDELHATCCVRITGPPAGIEKCKAVIGKLCLVVEEPFQMAHEDYRAIVGHCGEIIKQLQERLSILIETPPDKSSLMVHGIIKGLPQNIQKCKQYFEAKERESFTGNRPELPSASKKAFGYVFSLTMLLQRRLSCD